MAICLALLCAVPAGAQVQTGSLSRAADELRTDAVYVDPDAERALSADEAERLREQIRSANAGPIRIAVLPESAKDEAGGDAGAAAREIAESVGEPGTYAVIVGSSFRAGETGSLPAARLASEALAAKRSEGAAAVLSDFVSRVEEARRGGSSPGSGDPGGGGGGLFLLALLAIPALLFGLSRRRRRREQRDQLAEVKEFARDDLVALGEDIRALDLDVEMPSASPEAKQHYSRAVECYQAADEAWDAARRVEDMEGVSSLLEEGRYEMTAAKAALAGEAIPRAPGALLLRPQTRPIDHHRGMGAAGWKPARGTGVRGRCSADRRRPGPRCPPGGNRRRVDALLERGARVRPLGRRLLRGRAATGPVRGLDAGRGHVRRLGHEAHAADPGGEGFDAGDFGGGDFGGGFGGGDFGGGGDF